jgi:anti-sigma regulatory factor (Ser/Thr protein kinase)
VKLILPCIDDIELIAQSTLDQLQTMVGFSSDKLEQSKILINEAVINAVEHSLTEMNQIFIDFEVRYDELFMTIRDTGKGFEVSEITVPNLTSKIEQKEFRGWGLSIMKNLSDDFSIHSDENGTQVRINVHLID